MRTLVLALVFLTACSSLNKPPTPGRPEVDLFQQSPIFFGSSSTAPLNLSVTIRNPSKEPIVVRRIRLTAGMGMTQYSVLASERLFRETIAPGESKELNITATAYTDRVRLNPTEPLSLRTFVDYDAGGRRHQELYLTMVVSQ